MSVRKVFSDLSNTTARWVGRSSGCISLQQLPQHVAEAEHGVDLQPVGLAGQRRQRVIGAEDVARAVDQEDVVAGLQRAGRCGRAAVLGCGFGGLAGDLAGLGLGGAGMARMWAAAARLESMRNGAAVNHSAGCSAGARACARAAPRPAARTGSGTACSRTSPVQHQRADHAGGRHQQRDRAEVGDDAGLEQHRRGSPPSAGRRRDR